MRPTLLSQRLQNHRLIGEQLPGAAETVGWLGAVQSQEFTSAKWAVIQRCAEKRSAAFDRDFDRGDLLRVHILRPTWHFVAAEDLRWMQRLTRARVHALNAYQYRVAGLDDAAFKRGMRIVRRALERNAFLTRAELGEVLTAEKFPCTGLRLTSLVMWGELESVICSGSRRDKQQTYALVDSRVSKSLEFAGDEALAELGRRFFRSHGPATAADFSWWSSLSLTTAKRTLEMIRSELVSFEDDGVKYWAAPPRATNVVPSASVHFLSIYDESIVAYKDRRHAYPAERRLARENVIKGTTSVVLLDGVVIGSWKLVKNGKGKNKVETRLLRSLSAQERKGVQDAADHYGRMRFEM